MLPRRVPLMVGLPWTLPLVERCVLAQTQLLLYHIAQKCASCISNESTPGICLSSHSVGYVHRSDLYDAVFVPEINRNYLCTTAVE